MILKNVTQAEDNHIKMNSCDVQTQGNYSKLNCFLGYLQIKQ